MTAALPSIAGVTVILLVVWGWPPEPLRKAAPAAPAAPISQVQK